MITKEFDIIIIGSGAAGGVMAQELSPLIDQGKKIAVLEWGPKLKDEELTTREIEVAEKLYFDNGGMLTKDRAITVALGKSYGGSTTVYTGTSLKIPRDVLDSWQIPQLGYDDIMARSDKYFEQNNIHFTPHHLVNDNNRLFKKGCEALGYQVDRFPVNIKGCKGAGACNLGCPNHAKMGTNEVQLPAAEKAGVEVITNCRVDKIEEKALTAQVEELPYGHPSKWAPGKYRVKAKLIILCAGAVQTPALMLRSGLGKGLPTLGQYLTLHPALILTGQHDAAISNFVGHPKSYFLDHFTKEKRFILETCMYFPFTTAKSITGFGPDHSALMKNMDRLQMVLVLAFDDPEKKNRITIDGKGNPVIDYTLAPSTIDALYESMVVTAKVLFAAGCRRVHIPVGKQFFIENDQAGNVESMMDKALLMPGRVSVASAHPMGGARMGKDTADSVTDPLGRVHGLPWLMVADGSLFPRCSEVNPYITIMALADRIAEHLRSKAGEILSI